nr:ADP-ribosyl cyclase/cyclic ADP-ribose hydrolase [Ipomoea batatas]GMD92975.1 ADP-ribosyl cyclase/cyclic ADP-ribose hydrolase [Ipomoea batatas]
MPHLKEVGDALGVLTICLVALLVLLGLFCILYLVYFHARIRGQGYIQLGYFSGPWIIRITFILFAIWWGIGEVLRLSLLRRDGRLLNALNRKWQETVCKCYIVSNLGFAEPCLFLIVVFLLRASLQKSVTLNRKWNGKTAAYVLLFCLPVFVLQLIVISIGPKFNKESDAHKLPHYFTRAASPKTKDDGDIALCTYPLLSTICLGLFATILTCYLFWLGRRILHLVINKGLQKRVYTLILSVSGFLPLRVVLLGLSVLCTPGGLVYEILAFLGFLSLLCCAGVGICTLVYFPVADSLALRKLQRDIEARQRVSDDQHNDTISLIANQSLPGGSIATSPGRNSAASTKRGSISFRTMDKDDTSGAFVELSLFSPSQHSSPPDSPQLLGWPMLPPAKKVPVS